MRITRLGQGIFALSFAVLGALGIGLHGFASVWPLLPKAIAWHDTLTTIFAGMLLASGIALLIPGTAGTSALVLAGMLLIRLLLLQVPPIAAHPLVEATWEDLSEGLAQLAGAWTIYSMTWPAGRTNSTGVRAGQILFALALPAIGVSHFLYLGQTAPLIPSWLPFHVPLAYFTGAAHIAAGIGILFCVLPRLAATLEAVMVSLFTLLVWVPMVIAAPSTLANWAELCISAAISGSAWAVAASFGATSRSG